MMFIYKEKKKIDKIEIFFLTNFLKTGIKRAEFFISPETTDRYTSEVTGRFYNSLEGEAWIQA